LKISQSLLKELDESPQLIKNYAGFLAKLEGHERVGGAEISVEVSTQ
jgi:hypothetical protein